MEVPPLTQEPVMFVDATPNAEYPLRVLRAARMNANARYELTGEWDAASRLIHETMNEGCKKRAVLLDKAIRILEEHWNG